jgi:hypothetical protein
LSLPPLHPTALRARPRSSQASTALAAAGKGKDSGNATDKDRLALRQQALAWLQAELLLCKKFTAKENLREQIGDMLLNWQTDRDLAGVRDRLALAKLPEMERGSWLKLWSDVRTLEQSTRRKK